MIALISLSNKALSSIFNGTQPVLPQLRAQFGDVLGYALPALSYSRWSNEAFYVSVLANYRDTYDLERGLHALDYSFDGVRLALLMPFVIGFVARCIALVLLLVWNREKRR